MNGSENTGRSDLQDPYRNCVLCPRACGVDRTAGETGFCGQGAEMKAACVTLHKGEEPPVSGERGSGAFFFTGCTLRCPFCQNEQISSSGMGGPLSIDEFARICLEIEKRGGETINLVTATQFIPSAVQGLCLAKERGLSIPVVWNSGGFEKTESLALIAPVVDVYLPDCKTLDPVLSRSLFGRSDYPERAMEAVRFMAGQGEPEFSPSGIMTKGTIVRHLVLPGHLPETRQVLEWFSRELKDRALLSLMVQYIPNDRKEGGRRAEGAEPGESARPAESGRIGEDEYDQLLSWLDEFSIDEGFMQELGDDHPWIPDFDRTNPFPAEYSEIVWHWKDGARRFAVPEEDI